MKNNGKLEFVLIILAFLFFYFINLGFFDSGNFLFPGFELLQEYVREHILTCLLPAFFIAGAISLFVKKDFVLIYLGSHVKKYISYFVASLSGVILAVCSCTILPLFASIRKRGAGLGPAVTFLFAGPAINIAAIFLTISVLGVSIGIARIIASIFLAILVGLSMQLIFREKGGEGDVLLKRDSDISVKKEVIIPFFLALLGILLVNGLQIDDLIKYGLMGLFVLFILWVVFFKFEKETSILWIKKTWNFIKILLPVLFVGVFIVGVVMPFLPETFIISLVGTNSILANFIASIFGVFMYFSTLTEVPILQDLLDKGMAFGPALALLLAGPSLSLPNMLVIRKVLGNKRTFVYILLVIFYSMIAGLIFGAFF